MTDPTDEPEHPATTAAPPSQPAAPQPDDAERVERAERAERAAATVGPLAAQPGFAIIRVGIVGTVLFVVAMAVAVPLRTDRSGQVIIAATSMVLFAAGIATALWAYTSALERSRTEEVGVANLFLLSGPTAPKPVRRALWSCLGTQVVVAIAGASVGIAGLDKDQLNALAFGVLVPMFGIGVNGIWAAKHGTYGPRVAPSVRPTNRKIG